MNKTNKFENGKIYKLFSAEGNEVYIGSTCSSLKNCLRRHKGHYSGIVGGYRTPISSSEVISKRSCAIELVENYACSSFLDLRKREQYWIEHTTCVNKVRAYRSPEHKKEYYQKNRERILEYQNKHRDKYREYSSRYYQRNKDEINNRRKNKRKKKS